MAAGAWPISRIGILEQTKECCLERGAYPFAAATATKFVFHPVWWPANTFDGRETTCVHQMEVLPTVSERSSITLDIRDLVWLAFLACEVVERRTAIPKGPDLSKISGIQHAF